MSAATLGPLLFGAVVGYIVHFLIRRNGKPGIADLASIIGAVLGAAVMKALATPDATNCYLMGVGVGFFLHWVALLLGREKVVSLDAISRGLTLFPFLK